MKKLTAFLTAAATAAAVALPALAAGSGISQKSRKSALIFLCVISVVLLLFSVYFTIVTLGRKKARRNGSQKLILGIFYVATLVTVLCTVISFGRYNALTPQPQAEQTHPAVTEAPDGTLPPQESQETTAPTTEPEPEKPTLKPHHTEKTDPANWGIGWDIIQQGGNIVDTYSRPDPIHFGAPEDYSALPGVTCFRGNNYRNAPAYGHANVTARELEVKWKRNIGSLNGWPGSGWTGQPLMVQWDAETRKIMNLYEEKKNKDGLVEVILATLDGNVYFYDLDDGSYTRDPVFLGMSFKGAGTLDPRGYPLMYVGSGLYIDGKAPRMFAVSLIDGSILMEKSGQEAFTQRDWVAFDSSPMVSGETDTLIWPGESGILYTIKLNTQYDKAAGTISISPEETVKTRYLPERYSKAQYWIGYEPSCVIVDHYLYISENGGMFFCVDLNTMELVWAQDTRDDSNSTPVFEWGKDGKGYLYTAPSLHWTAQGGQGHICIYKLDAETGEIVWELPIDCHTIPDLSGGVQSSPLLGKPGTELEGMIFYTVARTPDPYNGKLFAIDTETGKVVWELSMQAYAWSSPVPIYNEDGTAHIVIADSNGTMSLVTPDGKVTDEIGLGSNVEASPSVFNDTLVVGTRGQLVCGIKVK